MSWIVKLCVHSSLTNYFLANTFHYVLSSQQLLCCLAKVTTTNLQTNCDLGDLCWTCRVQQPKLDQQVKSAKLCKLQNSLDYHNIRREEESATYKDEQNVNPTTDWLTTGFLDIISLHEAKGREIYIIFTRYGRGVDLWWESWHENSSKMFRKCKLPNLVCEDLDRAWRNFRRNALALEAWPAGKQL